MKIRPQPHPRSSEAGVSFLEVSIASVFFLGAILVSTKFQDSLNTGMRESTERLERRSTSSDILDRLDTVLRSSSANLSPFRVLDTQSPVLRDRIDNDLDGQVDELDEAFAFSPPLLDGMKVRSIWFQRIAGIDETTVPPTIKYDPPSFVQLVPDRMDPVDRRDNDGDGLIDEGALVINVAGGDRSMASNVMEFAIAREGQELIVEITLARPAEGTKEPEYVHGRRVIYVKNW